MDLRTVSAGTFSIQDVDRKHLPLGDWCGGAAYVLKHKPFDLQTVTALYDFHYERSLVLLHVDWSVVIHDTSTRPAYKATVRFNEHEINTYFAREYTPDTLTYNSGSVEHVLEDQLRDIKMGAHVTRLIALFQSRITQIGAPEPDWMLDSQKLRVCYFWFAYQAADVITN